jgi:endogenous inhibitor of DNA gyrase (YacG/DUF329 family)
MSESEQKLPRCPICRKDVELRDSNRFFPFCSKRCQMRDLGAWLNEEYTIPIGAGFTERNVPSPHDPESGSDG